MSQNESTHEKADWLDGSGLPHLLRIAGMAAHPGKLGIVLVALILTLALGTILDWCWSIDGGIGDQAIAQFVAARELDQPYVEPTGESGVFAVWRDHEVRCVRALLGSWSGEAPAVLFSGGSRYHAAPCPAITAAISGCSWLVRQHPFYFIIFGVVSLLIWSWGGGAVCRIAALQFARDEKPSVPDALRFSRRHLFDGFFLAPCIPIVFAAFIMLLMVIGGAVLRIPVLGDVFGGLAFIFSLLGGVAVALLAVGLFVSGHLFWPAVAAEGQDAYDSFSRALSYTFTRPWKTILYAIITFILAGVCWLVVRLFTYASLAVARTVVAFGTSPFGWWNRGPTDEPMSKLEMLWPRFGPDALYTWPGSGQLSWYEYISAFFIAVFVLLVIGLMWSYLISFYFSGSTVIYFLLRRDVDKTDLEDVFAADEAPSDADSSPKSPSLPEAPASPGEHPPISSEDLAVDGQAPD
ncbi:MAG: hypothetical protein KJ749_11425 [Planctomycetes bacterium]|nr:hypothetical protein [Planctomycetota bacterium]